MSRKAQLQNNLSLSSQSQISDDDSLQQQEPRIPRNNGNIPNHYNQIAKNQLINENQSSQQEDSEQDQPYFKKQNFNNHLNPKEQRIEENSNEQDASSQEQSQQSHSSIDYIEERIKKLEKDLQDRLERHKKPSNKELQNEKIQMKVPYSNKISNPPPRPQKFKQNQQNPKQFHLTNAQIQSLAQPKIVTSQLKPSYEQQTQKQTLIQPISKPLIQESKITKVRTKQNEDKKLVKYDNSVNVKRKQSKQHLKKTQENHHVQSNPQDKKYNKKFKEMQKTIEQLMNENKKLKAKLKSMDAITTQPKKKSAIQVVQLQQVASQLQGKNSQNKLQKQLELLQVIQKLQSKLKHSIGRKLSQMKSQSSSAILLHKGLSAGTIHH